MPFSSRRSFLKNITAAAVVPKRVIASVAGLVVVDKRIPMADVVVNRAPLAENRFYPLPLTSIRPTGWLLQQLQIQAQGLTGHLDEFWPDVGPQSGWLGGAGESWERGPYFLDGLVPLAHLLGDQRLVAKARKWIDWTLDNQTASGMIGPPRNDDWWPRIVMLKVLTQHHEATHDPRVIPVMQRYFAHQLRELPGRPLRDWSRYRWQDEVVSIIWLYNRTGDPSLLRLAELLRDQGYDWKKQFEQFEFKHKSSAQELGLVKGTLPTDRAMQTHGVNNAMGLKSSAVWWLFSKDPSDRSGVERQLGTLDLYHGMPMGMFSADEHLAGRNPSQGVELCTVVENMFSLEQALAILGDTSLGDRLERIAYNALPGALTDDMWAHQYDQQPNQIECSLDQRPWTTNGPESNLYGLEPNFGCCTANMHQGWPKFTSSLWMANARGGVAAIAYAPCKLRTRIAGIPIVVEEETGYPFDGHILLSLQPEKAVSFPLALRVPQWTRDPIVRLNGTVSPFSQTGGFAVIDREWKAGDQVELILPMKVAVRQWQDNAVVVERGPILFSLDIQTEWRKLRTRGLTADWEARPTSAWNYGLKIDAGNSNLAEIARPRKRGQSIFSLEGAPVRVEVQGRKVPQWKAENRVAGELPPSPVSSGEPVEKLTLAPYAAAKLRVTVFPTTS
ncbi:MAG: beta-L-arabinofuranosidase domain-containing protein [Candidatus Acidiferrum sp.]|jgi:DUF1680 family protein